ncbi:MAG: hypothetical protein ACTHMG_13895 [Sphingomonas sp.]
MGGDAQDEVDSPTLLPLPQLQAPAILFRRIESADGRHCIDEFVASAPLMFAVSSVLAVAPEERKRYWIRSALGKLTAADIEEIGARWWGRAKSAPEEPARKLARTATLRR